MRQVEILVPDEARSAVQDVLDEEEIDYVRTLGADDDRSIVRFPLPTQAVEHTLDRLRGVGLDPEYIVVTTVETASTPRFGTLEDRFVSGEEDDDSVAPEEIRTKALGLTPGRGTYYAMTLLSAVVATAGLLLNSPAIVVGSMVIAPLVSSALTASVGLVLDDEDMTRAGLTSQVLGLGLAVVGAAAFGLAIRNAGFVPASLDVSTINQIGQRISPGLLSLVVGVAAGASGAFGLATALPVSLVGVMIAAAVIPAAAAVGVGLAWNLPAVAAGAFVLLVVNIVSINLAGVAVLRYLGYHPGKSPDVEDDGGRGPLLARRSAAVVAAILVVGAVGGGALVGQMAFENATNHAVEDALSTPAYEDLELLEVRTEFDDQGLLEREETVTVVVRRPAEQSSTGLARAVGDRLAQAGYPGTVVEIEFVERQRFPPGATESES